ncbi:MAG: MBL fold metallo-hydrolase [Actinobacteria bacterium]|nr:MBL fold metallo-hydrolase [Actinomycetota bacterium]
MPIVPQPLPRELAPGLHWLGDCQLVEHEGEILHSYNSLYLVCGEESSLLVEAGFPEDHRVVVNQLETLLADAPPLRHIWLTHEETPHAGNIGRLLEHFPAATARGDIHDYHLYFPELEDRFEPLETGDSIDLGNREFVAVQAEIRDLITTQWGFDSGARALFPGDGFAYAHHHSADQCGHVVEEVEQLDLAAQSALFAHYALHWMRFVDMRPYLERLERLIDEREVAIACPTHGLPITDPRAVLPKIGAGLLSLQASATSS